MMQQRKENVQQNQTCQLVQQQRYKQMQQPTPQRCILRLPEVQKRTGYKRTHIYNLMKQGKFPQSFRIGIRAVGWDSIEIDQWIEDRLNAPS